MSVERFWVWICEGCDLSVTRRDYGLPPGWVFVKDRAITHRCPDCRDEVPPHRRGVPKVVARD